MPQRPRQHELETESRIAFRAALPARWIVRDVTPDYGVDFDVEIVADDGSLTGRQFLVQIKATDSLNGPEPHCIRLSSETLDYYRARDLPVLLVLYHAPSSRLSVRWVFDVTELRPEERGSTRSICFDESHQWKSTTASDLDAAVLAWRRMRSASLSLPLAVRLVLPAGHTGFAWSAIVQAEQALGLTPLLSLTALPREETIGEVFASEAGLDIDLKIRPRSHIDIPNSRQPQTATSLVANAAMAVARELANLGQARIASEIASQVATSSTIIKLPSVAGPLAHAAVVGDRLDVVLKLADWACGVDGMAEEAALFLITCALSADRLTAVQIAQLETVLVSRIDRALAHGDRFAAGVDTYNLGRLIGLSPERRAEAVRLYRKALALAPEYRERWYVWRELGALAFLSRRYRRAANCYLRAVQLGGDLECYAFLADALTYLGRYEEASTNFDAYLRHEAPEPHWQLKALAVQEIREWTGTSAQRLDESAEKRSLEALRRADNNPSEAETEFRNAIEAHGLCQVAWFNMGLAFLTNHHDYLSAVKCFVICALYMPRPDIEAWANAILAILKSSDKSLTGLAYLIVTVGHRQCGDSLYQRVMEGYAGEDRERTDALVSRLFARVIPHRRPSEIRVNQVAVDIDSPKSPSAIGPAD